MTLRISSPVSSRSNSSPVSPSRIASRRPATRDATVGTPHWAASRTVSPQPSFSDGWTLTQQAATTFHRSASGR